MSFNIMDLPQEMLNTILDATITCKYNIYIHEGNIKKYKMISLCCKNGEK